MWGAMPLGVRLFQIVGILRRNLKQYYLKLKLLCKTLMRTNKEVPRTAMKKVAVTGAGKLMYLMYVTCKYVYMYVHVFMCS